MREWIHRRVSHGIRGDCYGMVPVSNGGGREEGRRGIRKDRGIEGAGTGHARVAGLRVGERGREGGEGIRGIWKEGLRGDGGKKMARVQEREVYEAGCRGSLLCSLSPHSSPNPPPLPLHASFQRLFPTPLAHTTPPHLLPTPSLLPLSPTPFPHAFPSPLSPTSFPHAFSSPPSPPPTPFPHAFCSPHSPTHPLPPRNFLTPLPVQEDADLRVKSTVAGCTSPSDSPSRLPSAPLQVNTVQQAASITLLQSAYPASPHCSLLLPLTTLLPYHPPVCIVLSVASTPCHLYTHTLISKPSSLH
ncbi:unnamed protein product [Closterium sp. NIES-65]|nr:unnamed protein product [Closterium sp. NIES-65]